jgi:hypothetical protein
MRRWVIAAMMVAGCGEAAGTERSGFVAAHAVDELPNCNPSNNRTLYYVESTREFYYCDGSQYTLMSLSGTGGDDGVSWAIETGEASTCPEGGTTVRIGPDADGDGVIDEVRSSETICNGASCVASESGGVITLECPSGLFEIPIPSDGTPGAPGVDGVDGAPGEPCMVFTETDGLRIVCPGSEAFVPYAEPGQVGPQGPSGTDGTNASCAVEEVEGGAEVTCCTEADCTSVFVPFPGDPVVIPATSSIFGCENPFRPDEVRKADAADYPELSVMGIESVYSLPQYAEFQVHPSLGEITLESCGSYEVGGNVEFIPYVSNPFDISLLFSGETAAEPAPGALSTGPTECIPMTAAPSVWPSGVHFYRVMCGLYGEIHYQDGRIEGNGRYTWIKLTQQPTVSP